jgi:hypothetical protein
VTGCALCGASLARLRADARYCCAAHRAEASRLRRLWAGESVDCYATLADYAKRRQRRTQRLSEVYGDAN